MAGELLHVSAPGKLPGGREPGDRHGGVLSRVESWVYGRYIELVTMVYKQTIAGVTYIC